MTTQYDPLRKFTEAVELRKGQEGAGVTSTNESYYEVGQRDEGPRR
jgi:hypothetical protein